MKLFLALVLCATSAFAALPAGTVFEVRSTGSDTNGGGLVVGTAASGSDYTRQDTPQWSATDGGVTTGNATITTASADAGMVGYLVYIAGGTGTMTATWREVISVVAGVSITVEATTGLLTTTGATLHVGGALVSPGLASNIGTSGNTAYVQNIGADGNTTYDIPNLTAGSHGPLNSASAMTFQGYTTNRSLGNTDPRPRLRATGSTVTLVASAAELVSGFWLDGNGQTAARATNGGYFVRCYFTGFNTVSGGSNTFLYAESTANSAIVLMGNCVWCEAHANTATGIGSGGANQQISDSISWGNTGASSEGFTIAHLGVTVRNSIAWGNGQYGIYDSTTGGTYIINCISGNHSAGKGYSLSSNSILMNSYGFNNNSANNTASNTMIVAYTTLTTTPFVSAATGNFALNNLNDGTGSGATLRAAGFPSLLPAGLTAAYGDVGAAQHQDSGAGVTAAQRSFVTVN
jgi:hypothetical protein